MATKFKAQVRFQKNMAILELHGELNRDAEAALSAAYDEAEAGSPAVVLLNFQDVDYINSPGIALIVSLLARARKNKRRLVVCALSEHYQEIFRITRLAEYMQIFEDESSALAG